MVWQGQATVRSAPLTALSTRPLVDDVACIRLLPSRAPRAPVTPSWGLRGDIKGAAIRDAAQPWTRRIRSTERPSRGALPLPPHPPTLSARLWGRSPTPRALGRGEKDGRVCTYWYPGRTGRFALAALSCPPAVRRTRGCGASALGCIYAEAFPDRSAALALGSTLTLACARLGPLSQPDEPKLASVEQPGAAERARARS